MSAGDLVVLNCVNHIDLCPSVSIILWKFIDREIVRGL